jgi:hypothetical protein
MFLLEWFKDLRLPQKLARSISPISRNKAAPFGPTIFFPKYEKLWARPQKIHGNPKNQGCSP